MYFLPILRSVILLITLTCLLGSHFSFAANTGDWKPRSIYQVFTDRFARTDGSSTALCDPKEGVTCGGTWRGIINHLNYIQGMGFDAIMISPVTQNIDGSVEPFMIEECSLMVDVVINNMAYITNGGNPDKAIDYSIFVPFNSEEYFHPYCEITDYDNYDIAQKCWTGDKIVPLPDLKTEDDTVTQIMKTWVEGLITNYSIDGLRIDAAKHVDTRYLNEVVSASGVFATGEVYERDLETACGYQRHIQSVPNYPIYYAMIQAFGNGNMTALVRQVEDAMLACNDTFALGAFAENHDLPRFPSFNKDLSLAKNIIAFTILSDGIPMFYQGQEQHLSGDGTPANREALWLSNYDTDAPLYKFMALVNKIRKQAIRVDPDYLGHQVYPLADMNGISSFRKGNEGRHIIAIYSSHGEDGFSHQLRIPRSGHQRLELTEITTCENYTLDHWGALQVKVENGLPKIFFPANQMGGSGLCGFGDWPIRGSRTKGNGVSSSEETPWVTEVHENPKWGRRPGRLGSRPRDKQQKSRSRRAWSDPLGCLFLFALVAFHLTCG
uniref:alpha-amylase n=1 Tax=Coccidioides posadasii RMSCC 3488 TaxID=454284 RepID=A0A0J6IE41_COCPO|nr:alpha-amylase 1 [Coccidioides posadasii RMSCC 3488]